MIDLVSICQIIRGRYEMEAKGRGKCEGQG